MIKLKKWLRRRIHVDVVIEHLNMMVPSSVARSGMNIPDHISESLLTIFWVKNTQCFDADPGSGIFLTLDPGWKNSYPG
jgi:hypothetical protein